MGCAVRWPGADASLEMRLPFISAIVARFAVAPEMEYVVTVYPQVPRNSIAAVFVVGATEHRVLSLYRPCNRLGGIHDQPHWFASLMLSRDTLVKGENGDPREGNRNCVRLSLGQSEYRQ